MVEAIERGRRSLRRAFYALNKPMKKEVLIKMF
jgi:hypothetical protein